MVGKTTATSSHAPKHRACDECRSRKLACSKEADGCSRCRREGIACYYSPQKPMGRPRKRRSADTAQNNEATMSSSRRRYPTTSMQRSDSARSSVPSTGPEMHSFQLNSAAAPSSFVDHSFDFLDQQIGSPDMAFLDLLPGYYPDSSTFPPQPVSSSQPECALQSFDGSLTAPMAHNDTAGALAEIPTFLDPGLTAGQHGDNYDTYGTTPALSAGSHTPYDSESSYSPLPAAHGVTTRFHVGADEQAAAAAAAATTTTESLRPIPTVACPCLSSLYMSLESLANLPQDIPAALRVTRHASKIAHSVVRCKRCSSGMFDLSRPPPMQCFQNMMLLATLVPSACNAYTAIVEMIDRECHLAEQQGRRILFSVREIGGAWEHQAFGGNGCPPADVQQFDNNELAPHDWRRLMLAIIRLDVYGDKRETRRPSRLACGAATDPPSTMTMGLADVIAALDERNNKRHEMLDVAMASGFEPTHARHFMMMPRSCRPEDRNCVRVLEVARLALNNLVIA